MFLFLETYNLKIMKSPFYPCLWFDNNSREAADFYISAFHASKILASNPLVTTFGLMNTKFMALNGGPMYKMTPAFSYSVYCENEKETRRLYNLLSKHGNILIPLDKYDWSPLYAWIEDKFGVSWQLDANSSGQKEKIIPTLLFVNQKNTLIRDAVEYYKNIFPGSETIFEAPFPTGSGMQENSLLFARFHLNKNVFNIMCSTEYHDYDFTPGNSVVIECETQEEIDYLWEKLGKDGHYSMCGWLEDKYGVSWQIIPSVLPELMADPEQAQKVTAAFINMQKLEIEPILKSIR